MKIGIDLGGTKTEIIVLDDDGREHFRKRVPTPFDYDQRLDTIARLIDEAEREMGETCTVGIGTPGSVSPHSGLMQNGENLNGRPLDKDLAHVLGRDIRMANDANCLALSEATDGAGAGYDVVFTVILGTGVGGGLVVNGKLIDGPNAATGEWGHNPLPAPRDGERPGPDCYCGRQGCIETFLNGRGLARAYAEVAREELAPEDVSRLDTPKKKVAFALYTDRLARGLASIVNIIDPDVIVLGGGLSNIGQLYEEFPAALLPYVFSDGCTTPVVPARHGDSSGVRGAAWLWNG